MSNTNNKITPEQALQGEQANQSEANIESRFIDKTDDFNTDSLREASFEAPKQTEPPKQATQFKVKQPIPRAQPAATGEAAQTIPDASDKIYSAADIVRIAKEIEHNIRKSLAVAGYVPGATQAVAKENAPELTIDFSKLTMDDIYDLTIPIQAKAFGSTDALKVELVDKNYEPRWVNKNPRRLGQFLAYGFTYVEEKDLARRLEVEVVADAQGHFCLDDVVLMRIPKAQYYAALKAAHERAIRTVNSVNASATGKEQAMAYMQKQGGADFNDAVANNKMEFYRPGIEI